MRVSGEWPCGAGTAAGCAIPGDWVEWNKKNRLCETVAKSCLGQDKAPFPAYGYGNAKGF